MIYRENIGLMVNVEISILDVETGALIDKIQKHNLVTLSGRNFIRDLLNRDVPGLNYFAVGTGTAAPAATNIALGTEIMRGTLTSTTKTDGSLNVKYYLTSGNANGSSLTEAGLFSNTTLFARLTHTAINKTASIAVTYSWDVGITAV
jgi:hypothetical protein